MKPFNNHFLIILMMSLTSVTLARSELLDSRTMHSKVPAQGSQENCVSAKLFYAEIVNKLAQASDTLRNEQFVLVVQCKRTPFDKLDAAIDGTIIHVDASWLTSLASVDEIAFIFAHELAHREAELIALQNNGIIQMCSENYPLEQRVRELSADVRGSEISVTAGYSVWGGVAVLKSLSQHQSNAQRLRNFLPQKDKPRDHPWYSVRIHAVKKFGNRLNLLGSRSLTPIRDELRKLVTDEINSAQE